MLVVNLTKAQELQYPLSLLNLVPPPSLLSNPNKFSSFSLPTRHLNPPPPHQKTTSISCRTTPRTAAGTSIKHLAGKEREPDSGTENGSVSDEEERESMGLQGYDMGWDNGEVRKNLGGVQFESPVVEVKELEELPENWRRSKLAWLCKELPSQKRPTQFRLLNAQKKWVRQEDATYIAHHFLRIRVNDSAFAV